MDQIHFASPTIIVQPVSALKATKAILLILTKDAQSKELSVHQKVVMLLLAEEMKFVKLAVKEQFVTVKMVSHGILNRQLVKNHLCRNAHNLPTANKMKLVVLMFSAFSNVSQSVQNSTVHHSRSASLKITKEVVNVYQDIEEIRTIEMVAHQIEKINVRAIQNAQNRRFVFASKEFQNVLKLATVSDVVQTQFA